VARALGPDPAIRAFSRRARVTSRFLEANDSIAGGLKPCRAGVVGRAPIARVVDIALELQHESFRGAIRVHDEALQDVLAAKLEAEHGTVAEQRPSPPLGRGRGSIEGVGLARRRVRVRT